MPRPRISQFWIDHIRVHVANHPEWSGAAIRKELQKVKDARDVPSDRAIRRAKEEFLELNTQDRAKYLEFKWPESMEQGALPWEAARASLNLCRRYRDAGAHPPLIQECVWFWRVTLAAPDLAEWEQIRLAAYLIANSVDRESDRGQHALRTIETALTYQSKPMEAIKFPSGPSAYLMMTLFKLWTNPGSSSTPKERKAR